MKRSLFRSMRFWPFRGRPKTLLPWNIQGSGNPDIRPGGRPGPVWHPVPTLVAGVIFFGGLGLAVFGYTSAGFGGNTALLACSDSAAGQVLLTRYFPQKPRRRTRPA